MRADVKSTRFHERTNLRIPVDVYYQEGDEQGWTESALTEQITVCGVGLNLSRPVELNRLVQLSLPMPKGFRLFDFAKPQYQVWAVVCDIQLTPPVEAGRICLNVGTALIGAKPPVSFKNNPQTLYDLKPILRNQSFWDVREMPRRTGPYRRSMEERQEIAINVIVDIIDETGRIIASVEGETINVSEGGMAIITKPDIPLPKYALIRTEDKSVSLLAAVRSFHELNAEQACRLHVEFLSGRLKVAELGIVPELQSTRVPEL